MIKHNRDAENQESISILNMYRICKQFGWTPKEYMEQDDVVLQYFEQIARLEIEQENKNAKKSSSSSLRK